MCFLLFSFCTKSSIIGEIRVSKLNLNFIFWYFHSGNIWSIYFFISEMLNSDMLNSTTVSLLSLYRKSVVMCFFWRIEREKIKVYFYFYFLLRSRPAAPAATIWNCYFLYCVEQSQTMLFSFDFWYFFISLTIKGFPANSKLLDFFEYLKIKE